MTKLLIGFFADGPWAHLALELLLRDSSVRIAFICPRFDRPDDVLRQEAEAHQIDFLTCSDINSDEFYQTVGGYGGDLFVSMSFDQIFRRRLLEHPALGTIN